MAKHKHSMYLVVLATLIILFGLVVVLDGCNTIVGDNLAGEAYKGVQKINNNVRYPTAMKLMDEMSTIELEICEASEMNNCQKSTLKQNMATLSRSIVFFPAYSQYSINKLLTPETTLSQFQYHFNKGWLYPKIARDSNTKEELHEAMGNIDGIYSDTNIDIHKQANMIIIGDFMLAKGMGLPRDSIKSMTKLIVDDILEDILEKEGFSFGSSTGGFGGLGLSGSSGGDIGCFLATKKMNQQTADTGGDNAGMPSEQGGSFSPDDKPDLTSGPISDSILDACLGQDVSKFLKVGGGFSDDSPIDDFEEFDGQFKTKEEYNELSDKDKKEHTSVSVTSSNEDGEDTTEDYYFRSVKKKPKFKEVRVPEEDDKSAADESGFRKLGEDDKSAVNPDKKKKKSRFREVRVPLGGGQNLNINSDTLNSLCGFLTSNSLMTCIFGEESGNCINEQLSDESNFASSQDSYQENPQSLFNACGGDSSAFWDMSSMLVETYKIDPSPIELIMFNSMIEIHGLFSVEAQEAFDNLNLDD